MKRLVSLLLVCAFCIPCIAFAAPQTIDLDAMSFEELVALRAQIDIAVMKCQEWQEVDVPQGIYEIGVDIPVGHWTLKAKGERCTILYGNVLEAGGHAVDIWSSSVHIYDTFKNPKGEYYNEYDDKSQIDIDMRNGYYIQIDDGTCVFSPYTGKPDLGFK